jgi:hypothetical protein
MAFVVGTDTYISLADAQTYINDHYISTDSKLIAWNCLSDTDMEVLLRKALSVIDKQPLVGYKATSTQTLEFPRAIYTEVPTEIYDPIPTYGDNWYVQTAVPSEVKYAQCEIAVSMASGTSNRVNLQRQGVKSFTLGNLSETYSGAQNSILSYEAKELLLPYMGGGVRIA